MRIVRAAKAAAGWYCPSNSMHFAVASATDCKVELVTRKSTTPYKQQSLIALALGSFRTGDNNGEMNWKARTQALCPKGANWRVRAAPSGQRCAHCTVGAHQRLGTGSFSGWGSASVGDFGPGQHWRFDCVGGARSRTAQVCSHAVQLLVCDNV